MSDEKPETEQEAVNLEDLPPDEQEQIRGNAIAYMRTGAIVKGQKESKKKRKRKGGKLHHDGSHWYELEGYFDPSKIEATPIEDSGFMMGILEDMVVVEVKADWPSERIAVLGQRLADMGIKALVITEGIRFLRLKGITGEEETRLNAIVTQQKQRADETRQANDGESTRNDTDS